MAPIGQGSGGQPSSWAGEFAGQSLRVKVAYVCTRVAGGRSPEVLLSLLTSLQQTANYRRTRAQRQSECITATTQRRGPGAV